MKLQPYSWDGHVINDGENYSAIFPAGSGKLQPASEPVLVERPYNAPVFTYAGRTAMSLALIVFCEGEVHEQVEQLKEWFDTTDVSLKELVCRDAAGSGSWKLDCVVRQIVRIEGHAVTIQLVAPDGIWQSANENSDSWSITASGQTHDVDVAGTKFARPTFEITPTAAKTGVGLIYKRWVPLYSNVDDPLTGYPIELSDGGFDTATLVSGGKMQADGDDLRVFVDGAETTRWLVDMNTASTLIWTVLDLGARREVDLDDAIAGAGSITEITYQSGRDADRAFADFPPEGVLLIDDEAFVYTGKDSKEHKFTGVTRAAKGTSIAAHASGATVRLIQHDIWLCYGDSGLGAPDSDDSRKPIFELDSSSNTEWDYDEFQSSETARAAQWEAGVVKSRVPGEETDWYTANQETDADPAEEMGLRVGAYDNRGRWRGDRGLVVWTLSQPCGIDEVTASGEYYRYGSAWPKVGLQYGTGSGRRIKYKSQWELSSPTEDTWTAWNKPSESLGATAVSIQFFINGSVGSGEDNRACLEAADVTVSFDSDVVPTVAIGAEQGGYELDCRITNNETGEWIKLHVVVDTNETIIVDTEAKTVVYDADGSNYLPSISFSSVRQQWLKLLPGQSNELQFDDTGTQGVTFVTKWRDRHL
jgi:hypothetical protein